MQVWEVWRGLVEVIEMMMGAVQLICRKLYVFGIFKAFTSIPTAQHAFI
jgi:hypothetical protein